MLTIGWLAVAFGVLAMLWADGRFPFSPRIFDHRQRVIDVTFTQEKA
jgi:hypothetical protein